MTTPGCTTARRRTGSTADNAVEPREGDEHRVAVGHGAAREPGAGPARDERHAGQVEQAHQLAHLVRRARHDDDARIGLPRGQAIHGVGLELGPPVPHPAGADDAAERLDQGEVAS